MVSDEEIRRFMEKYYPEWANNLELGRILYEKFRKRLQAGNANMNEPEQVKINDIHAGTYSVGSRVTVKGVITDIDVGTYIGCPICHRSVRRGCEHLATGQVQESTIYRVDLRIADDTGNISISLFPMNEQEYNEFLQKNIQVGDVIRVVGKVWNWKGNYEVQTVYDSIKIERKVQIDVVDMDPVLKDIVNTLRKLRRVKKQIYESMCRSKGVNPQTLIELGYIIENGDYVEVVKNE